MHIDKHLQSSEKISHAGWKYRVVWVSQTLKKLLPKISVLDIVTNSLKFAIALFRSKDNFSMTMIENGSLRYRLKLCDYCEQCFARGIDELSPHQ